MVKVSLRKPAILFSFILIFSSVTTQQSYAQAGNMGTQQQKIRWLSVTALRSWFSNFGAEIDFGRRDRATFIATDQIDGLCWPNEYNSRMKGVKVSKALWIGTTNFTDPVTNITYPHKVVCSGPWSIYSGTEIIADESFGEDGITLLGKYNHPEVYVDNVNASARQYDDNIDVIDNSIPADRMIVNKFNTGSGISITRKILAFTQQYNDNYYIYEYTLKNTGIIDDTGEKKLNKTLTDVIFYLQSKYSFAGESYSGRGFGDWSPSSASWGRNTINDAIGQDATHTGEFRAVWSYWGPMSSSVVQMGIPEDIGCPGPNRLNVYTLAGTQFAGTVVLHAEKSPHDNSDDKLQPATTQFVGTDNPINQNDQFDQNRMTQKYTQFMNAGHPAFTQAEQIGKDANGWPSAYANTWSTDAGGYKAVQGFGPYTLAPGDSIRIVVAEAVAGINHDKIREVALNWFNNNTSGFILPKGYKNGGTTADRNEYKNAWVFSGKDSLFQTFRRALANYNSNYNIPQPPPPPDKFYVSSKGGNVLLRWNNNAESYPHFNGYRIYRAEGRTDTTFDMVFECNKNNVVNSFNDGTAKSGIGYFYYIQSKDDGSTNNIQPGIPLTSSKYYTMTNVNVISASNTGDICSYQSGDWNNKNTWTMFDGTNWVHPSPVIPSDTDSTITILAGHTVSVLGNSSAAKLLIAVNGTLEIKNNAELFLKNRKGNDLTVYGIINNFGTIKREDDSTEIKFIEGSQYFHDRDGGAIPVSVWEPGSLCQINGVISVTPADINQKFGSFTWDCPNQTGNINLSWHGKVFWTSSHLWYDCTNTVDGVMTIKNTGSGILEMCSPDADSSVFVSINGNFIQTGGNFTLSSSNNPGTKITVINKGNLDITGGTFSISSGSQGGTGTSEWNLYGSHFSLSDASFQNSNTERAQLLFSGGQQSLLFGKNNKIDGLSIHVLNGVVLDLNNIILDGKGSFVQDSGSALVITHPGGLDSTIKVTGTKKFFDGANYIFNGSSAQVTGNAIPGTAGDIIIDNPNGLYLSKDITVNGTLELKNGRISSSDKKLSYGPNGKLKYSGNNISATTDIEFPAINGPSELIINSSNNISLHAPRKIKGNVTLSSGQLVLGPNSLSAASVKSNSTSSFIATDSIGSLSVVSPTATSLFDSHQLPDFIPIGIHNTYSPVFIRNTGNTDTISVNVASDSSKVKGAGRVKLRWKISEKNPGFGKYQIGFGWAFASEDAAFKKKVSNKYIKIIGISDTTEFGDIFISTVHEPLFVITRTDGIRLDSFTVVTLKTNLTDIEDKPGEMPVVYKLNQNFPNPFNPSTMIRYSLPSASSVKIVVYNILGVKIRTLVNKINNAGYHEINFDAGSLASGIYFYSIEANAVDGGKSFREVKKMMLLK